MRCIGNYGSTNTYVVLNELLPTVLKAVVFILIEVYFAKYFLFQNL